MYTVSAFLSLKENTGRYNSTEAESMRDAGKQAAGRAAAMRVTNGMCVGLGSGSTAAYFIVALAERVQHEGLKIRGIAPSRSSCLLYTSPSPRDGLLSRMPSSA